MGGQGGNIPPSKNNIEKGLTKHRVDRVGHVDL